MRPSRSATRAADLCNSKVHRFYLQPAGLPSPTMACVSLTPGHPCMSETLVPSLTLLMLCPTPSHFRYGLHIGGGARLGRGPLLKS